MLRRIVTSGYNAESVTTVEAFPWSSAAKKVKNPKNAKNPPNAAQLNPGSDHSTRNFSIKNTTTANANTPAVWNKSACLGLE